MKLNRLIGVVVAACGVALRVWAQVEIVSFESSGRLVCSNLAAGSTATVEWASSLTGPWTNNWSGLNAVVADSNGLLDVSVPMFYRVHGVAATPEAGDYLVIDLSAGPSASSYPVSNLAAIPPGGWTDEYKTTKLVLRRIPKGTFTMGSPAGELGRVAGEDQHQVTLTKDFYMGVFEVTQKQWERVMGTWPSWFNNPSYANTRPVEQVSYHDVRENPNNSAISPNWPQSAQVQSDSFMGKLRAKTGLSTLDLPTESQWEYACRAGTATALNSEHNLTSIDNDPQMSAVGRYWYNGGSGNTQGVPPSEGTAPVGTYQPNAWALYDMHGNVYEWCLDWHDTYPDTVVDPVGAASRPFRVARGGSCISIAENCRSADRASGWPGGRSFLLGFRLARTLP